MIKFLETEPKPSGPVERTPGRGEGLQQFAEKLISLYGRDLALFKVLDVGGGDGWLGEMLPVLEYWCLDPYQYGTLRGQEASIQSQRRFHVHGFAESLFFSDQFFDLVVSKQTLIHFKDPARACQEMCRVSKQAVVIRQEFPEEPIGWVGHSRVTIDSPHDILAVIKSLGAFAVRYDGIDFVARRE